MYIYLCSRACCEHAQDSALDPRLKTIYCSVSCTDRIVSLDLNACGFVCICLLTLKAVSPIDCHYMTDILQRFELS